MKIDKDTCEEILVTITRNKTRSLLTAFGVFWGIFMLVALMGGGQGMEQELRSQFEGFATNSGFVVAQQTGEAYKGFRKGRTWDLEVDDVERIRQIEGIEVVTPSIAQWGKTAAYEGNKYDCSVKGLYPNYERLEHQEMAYGRFINDVDIREARKVCVIGKRVYESLFPKGGDPCGAYVQVDSVYYRVVGMCASEGNVNIQGQASEAVTLPYTTMQQMYNLGNTVEVICFTMKPGVRVKDVKPQVEQTVKAAHYISPDDRQAVMMLDLEAMFSMMDNLMKGVRILTWMVGPPRHRRPSARHPATDTQRKHGADHRGRHGGHIAGRAGAASAGGGRQPAGRGGDALPGIVRHGRGHLRPAHRPGPAGGTRARLPRHGHQADRGDTRRVKI